MLASMLAYRASFDVNRGPAGGLRDAGLAVMTLIADTGCR